MKYFKNKYFRRGLNLNVQDRFFFSYASVFMEGTGQKPPFSLNLHALNAKENCFHQAHSSTQGARGAVGPAAVRGNFSNSVLLARRTLQL